MTPEELRRDEANRWLAEARRDLNAARILANAEPSRSLFHSQQAAEKSAKAFLAFRNVPFRRIHDLDELGSQCTELDSTLGDLAAEVAELSAYATIYRYPNMQREPDEEEAAIALALAQEMFDQAKIRIE